jgi:integrase
VKLTQRLLKALKAHRHLRGDRVLLLDDGTSFNRETVRKWTMRIERRANLPETGRFHIFRHTFCAHLGDEGRADEGDSGARGARRPDHDHALHAPVSGSERWSDRAARSSAQRGKRTG